MAPVNAPSLEAEQLGLQKLRGKGGAIDLDERLLTAVRAVVQRTRDQLLAGAALTPNQHRDIRVGDTLDQVAHLGHGRAVAEQHRVAGLLLDLIAQRCHFLRELPLSERVAKQDLELGVLERLADEVGRAELHRLHDRGGAALAGDDDDRHVPVDLPECGKRRQAVHGAGHHHIEEHRCGTIAVKAPDRFVGAGHRQGGVSARSEEGAKEPAHRQVIIDNHYLLFLAHRSTYPQTPATQSPG